MADNSKAYKEALKQLDNMLKKQEALKKSTENLNSSWNAIASEIFKMDGAQFFKNVEKSPEQLKEMGKEITMLEESFKNLGNDFAKTLGDNKKFQDVQKSLRGIGDEFKNSSSKISSTIKSSFSEIYNSLDNDLKKIVKSESDLEKILKNKDKLTDVQKKKLKEFSKFQELEKIHNELGEEYQKKLTEKLGIYKKLSPEIALMNQDVVAKMISQIAAGEELEKILEGANDEERKFLAAISDTPKKLNDINKGMAVSVEEIGKIKKEAGEMNKQFSLSKSISEGLSSVASGFGSIIKKDWIGSMMKFDEVLNKVQKETSINMDDNAESFAKLQTNVAQFGVSLEQAAQTMGDMSKELNTTNFSVLSKAAEDFAAIEGATGAASGDITNLAGELMRMGESSGQVKDFMQGADQEARKFGVSSAKVLGNISKNMSRMRKMGFVGGEESLKKLSIEAEKLHMNIDSLFDMSEQARSIEGAMDMAAELQLAGGSFANINPMDLLAAARKGPAEMKKILTTMGKDIGKFNDKGEYEFDPIDADRLRIAADAAHVPVEEFQKMIAQNAIDAEKLNPFQGVIDNLDVADQDLAKSALGDMLKRGADGTITVDADNDMAKKMGINSLEDINSENIKAILDQKTKDAVTLEEQNKRNQSLKQSFDNFINALMSIFSSFQPALEVLTTIMQKVTSVFTEIMNFLPGWSKWLLGGLVLAFTMFGTSVGAFILQGVGGFLKGTMSFVKGTADFVKKIASGEGGGMLKGLGGKIKSKFFGGKDGGVEGPAEAGLGTGGEIADKKGMTPEAGSGIKGFFKGLSEGIQEFGKVKWMDLLKFAAALVIIGGAIIGFGFAMATIGGDAGIGQMVTAAVSLGMLMGSIWLLSKIAKSVDMGGVLKGALAMLVVGASLVPFALAAQMLTGVDLMGVLAAIGILTLVVLGLALLGLMMTGPQILLMLFGAAILVMVGAALVLAASSLLIAAEAFKELATVDWDGFSKMGDALLNVVPGLFAFSLAAMMFLNPLTLLGIIFMAGALSMLVAVMAPLAESLTVGADSLDRFASGLEKLSAAADKLSLEKLQSLKDLSDSMAGASSSGTAMAAMAAIANGANGGAGGDGEVRKIEVNVKMNGRDLQNFIVKDTAIIK